MLSIGIVKNPQDAARYYAQDDYYLNAGGGPDAQGQWAGRATDAMGLSGPVEREGFQALLDGTLPNGERLGRTVDGKREHPPGWDLTFSAPKSVSDKTSGCYRHITRQSGTLSNGQKKMRSGPAFAPRPEPFSSGRGTWPPRCSPTTPRAPRTQICTATR